MRRTAIPVVATLAVLATAPAALAHHAPKHCVVPKLTGMTLTAARHKLSRAHCSVGHLTGPRSGDVTRQVPRAGRKLKHGSKVRLTLKAKGAPAGSTLTTTTPSTTTTTPTPTVPTPTPTPTVVRAGIDPDFTQDPTDNLKVTWSYSASAAAGATALPDGVLSFSVTPATGSLGPVGGCTINVGAVTTGGTCTIELSSYGTYSTTVTYTGSGSSIAPSTQTGTDTIEPLPVINIYQWGTDAPTQGPSIQTVLDGSAATVTVDDQNFEGATSVNLTDSTGAQCTATVSGITATCAMTDIATPTSYTLSYPGGTTTTTNVSTDHNGVRQVTDQWPATVVEINNPQVTIQQVTLVECGGRAPAASWGSSTNFGCTDENTPKPWPTSLTTSAGGSGNDAVTLDAWAYGSLQDDSTPSGTVNYNISPGVEGTDYTIDTTMCGPQCGFEELSFLTPGTYTVSTSFTSTDPNYPDVSSGPSITITVVS